MILTSTGKTSGNLQKISGKLRKIFGLFRRWWKNTDIQLFFCSLQTGNIFRSMDSLVLRHPIICTEFNVRNFLQCTLLSFSLQLPCSLFIFLHRSQLNPQLNPQLSPQLNPQLNPQLSPQLNPQLNTEQTTNQRLLVKLIIFYKKTKNYSNCAYLLTTLLMLCILLYRIGNGGNKLFVFVFRGFSPA
jgi:hypothetical protein